MTKRPSYHDLLRNDGIPPSTSDPIPTKPRPKAQAKRKGKARRMVVRWCWLYIYGCSPVVMDYATRAAAVRHRETQPRGSTGAIVRVQFPAPAGKGGGT